MGNSSASTRRMSTGTGFNKNGKKNGKPTIGRLSSNKSEIHIDPFKYLAYKRFGMLNQFVFLVSTTKVTAETKFASLLLLNYVFQSGQSAIMLDNLKMAQQERKFIAHETHYSSDCKIIQLKPYLSDRFQENAKRALKSPQKTRKGFLTQLKHKMKYAAAVAAILVSFSVFSANTINNFNVLNNSSTLHASSQNYIENQLVPSDQAQADMDNDTIWAEGIFRTRNIETNLNIGYVDLTVKATYMEMVIPETNYYYTTNNAGSMGFILDENTALPVYIDIFDQIEELNNSIEIITTTSGEITALFDRQTQGTTRIYNSSGVIVLDKSFYGTMEYFSLDEQVNGIYIVEIQTNDDRKIKKFIKASSNKNGSVTRPSKNTKQYKRLSTETATYMVKWEKEGYFTDSTEVTINQDWNGVIDLYLSPIPPLTQDVIVNVKNLDQDNLNNVLVYLLNTTNGHVDSLRTNTSGTASFLDRVLGTNYLVGVGDKAGYFVWEGMEVNIPDEITNPADTTRNEKYTLYPRQAFSPLNDVIVDFNIYNIKEIFGKFNGMLSINGELAGWWDVDSFTIPGQYEILMQQKDNFENLTGIDIIDMPNEDTNPPINNPYTDLRWTNFSRGPPQTNGLASYTMTNGPIPLGESVTINADITLNGNVEAAFWKEMGRLMGYGEGGENWMAGASQPIDDENLGMLIVNTAMGQARFMYFNHNTQRVDHLKDNFELIGGKKSSQKYDSSAVFVHPKHQAQYQQHILDRE